MILFCISVFVIKAAFQKSSFCEILFMWDVVPPHPWIKSWCVIALSEVKNSSGFYCIWGFSWVNATIFVLFLLCRRAHTLTVLFILTCALVYVTLLEETPQDTTYNTKRSVSTRKRLQNCNCKFVESLQALSSIFIDLITHSIPACLYFLKYLGCSYYTSYYCYSLV